MQPNQNKQNSNLDANQEPAKRLVASEQGANQENRLAGVPETIKRIDKNVEYALRDSERTFEEQHPEADRSQEFPKKSSGESLRTDQTK